MNKGGRLSFLAGFGIPAACYAYTSMIALCKAYQMVFDAASCTVT